MAGTNLLAGRALKRIMHPFVPQELGNAFDLERALQYGLLPIVVASESPDETLKAYTQLYLKEEIQAEALVRNLPGFARFLPVAALSHGQSINATNIAREAAVSRTTVNGYLEILEETLLCFRLPGYEAKLRLRERKLPKWYWCDPGIVRTMKGTTGTPVPEERGALFEGLVAQTIRAYKDYTGLCDDWFYWAPVASRETEVDFLLQKGKRMIAIEVKAGNRFQEAWCTGLRAITPLPGLCRRIVVCPNGPRMQTTDGIEVASFADFENWLATGTLWPCK
jgi:uncharacterized protein